MRSQSEMRRLWVQMRNTYTLVDAPDGRAGITCLVCQRTSWNPRDVQERYCGFCKRFHDDRETRRDP